jgi:hypothetical protein
MFVPNFVAKRLHLKMTHLEDRLTSLRGAMESVIPNETYMSNLCRTRAAGSLDLSWLQKNHNNVASRRGNDSRCRGGFHCVA